MKKSFVLSGLILVVITVGLFFVLNFYIYNQKQIPNPEVVNENIQPGEDLPSEETNNLPIPEDKLKTPTFSGTLEEVNVGCFADGECYVVVDGKHVTVLRGWSLETVGSVLGVEGFGNLESFIGEKMAVYAQDLGDGTYTLYGSEEFYIKTLNTAGASGRIGEVINLLDLKITPLEVLEDSRCPIDVQCIQAGTVRLLTNLESAEGKSEQMFVLGEAVTMQNAEISLFLVEPITDSKTSIASSDYTFYFKVKYK